MSSRTVMGNRATGAGVVAVAVVVSLLASSCSTSVSTADQISTGGSWDPASLSAISVNASGVGAKPPVYEGSVVTDSQGLAVSLQPVLQATKAPAAGQYQFTIMTVAGAKYDNVWQGQSSSNKVTVPANVLRQGDVYLWQAVEVATNRTFGPYSMLVDAQRSSVQPAQSFGEITTDLASGSLSYGISPRTVNGASGVLGVNLTFQAGMKASPGLPGGWTIQPNTPPSWSYLQTFPGSGVTPQEYTGAASLVSPTGMTTAFTPTTGGGYMPISPAGRPAPTSSDPTLVKNPDGTWTATMPSGQVSVFAAADSNGVANLAETFNGTTVSPEYSYSDGKLVKVTDSVSTGVEVNVQYQGSGHCPDVPNGFTESSGGLCAITYPDGSSTDFFYLQGSDGNPILARVVDYPDTHDSKSSVTDIGYDQASRIVALRSPVAADAQASGVRTDGQQLLTTVGYDPQGRVSSVVKPAALAGSPQPSYSIVYSPGQTSVISQTSIGKDTAKYTYDPTTLLPLKTIDDNGKQTVTTWNTAQDLKLTDTDEYGRVTTYKYDPGTSNLTSTVGPISKGAPTSQAASTTYTYDQDLSGAQPRDLNGFNVTYWANGTMTGTPDSRTFGPAFNGAPPSSVDWSWSSSPTNGGSNAWSTRLTGTITTTAKAVKGKNPSFTFSASDGVQMWIDGVACSTASGATCDLPLAPGPHGIRIDLAVKSPDESGSAGLAVNWKPPNASNLVPIPMTAIRPGFGSRSVANKNDALSLTQGYNAKVLTEYDDAISKPTTAWVQDVPGIKGTTDYEPFDPDQQAFGRESGAIAPAGNETKYTYYQPDEDADVPCSGMGSAAQNGGPKTVTRNANQDSTAPGAVLTYQYYYDQMGRRIASDVNGQGAMCFYMNDAGEVAKITSPARDQQPATEIEYFRLVDGDPLKSATTYQVGDKTYTAEAETDLYGRPTVSTDIWGTRQVSTYDPYSGKPMTVTTTTASGFKSEETTTYDVQGDIATVVVDGKTVVTQSPMTGQGRTITYGNGVVQRVSESAAGLVDEQQWTTSDGRKFSYQPTVAPSQRVLAETFDFAGTSAKYDYTYDQIGRLVGGKLATALPVSQTSWQYGFETPTLGTNRNAGLNSNRTKRTIDNVSVDYGYNGSDQLTDTSDPQFRGTVGYDSWGEMTNLGTLTIDYDGGGAPVKVSDSATGESITYTTIAGNVVGKTVKEADGSTVESRYTAGGFVLDNNNDPQWQVMALPGGTTVMRRVGGSEQWQHQTVRGQLMWASDSTGKDSGVRHLYSPFGEELTTEEPVTAGGAPSGQTGNASTEVGKKSTPLPSSSGPTSSVSPTGTAVPEPSAPDVPAPNLEWQAGHSLETDHVGINSVILMGHRLYVPALGRFTSPDPVDQGSINAYDYANQDPIDQSDPTGALPSWLESVLVSAAIMVLSAVMTMGLGGILAVAGISASATTVAGQAAYVGSQIAIAAALSVTGDVIASEAAYHSPTPKGLSLYTDLAAATISMTFAGWMAKAAVSAISAARAVTGGIRDAVAAAGAAPFVAVADGLRAGRRAVVDTLNAVLPEEAVAPPAPRGLRGLLGMAPAAEQPQQPQGFLGAARGAASRTGRYLWSWPQSAWDLMTGNWGNYVWEQ